MRSIRQFVNVLFWLISLSACLGSPTEALQPTLAPGMGGISGNLSAVFERWPGETVIIYAAPFLGGGTYILDALNHPQTKLDTAGGFTLVNLAPGNYVLIAGPSAEQGVPILDDAGELLIIEVSAGSILPIDGLNLD